MKPKLCTDLEQSNKLVEILPIESADMVLLHEEPYETSDSKFDGLHQALCVAFSQYDKSWRQKYRNISYFPCWSLAALLEQLDFSIINEQEEDLVLQIEKEGLKYYLHYDNEHTGDVCEFETLMYDDLVDACVEMIIKLKNKNLL